MKLRVLLGLGLALLAGACGGEKRPAQRVVVIGADGLEWRVLRPLLQQGKCPNLRALMERGSFGNLRTMIPTLSPILWTTIATGKPPEEHGILGFTDENLQQYTSTMRKVRALWNIADRCELESSVHGWWNTWPVEELRGHMVAGSSSSELAEANWKPALIPGAERQVWPLELEPRVMAMAQEHGTLAQVQALATTRIFGRFAPGELGEVEQELIRQTLWSVQADMTYAAIAEELLRTDPGDLNMVYFGGTDVISHRFWRYYEPQAFRWPADPQLESRMAGPKAQVLLARAIDNYYEWFDELLGRLLQAAGDDATVLVISDHGFHAHSTDKPNPLFITGHHLDGPAGVFIAAGPGIVQRGDVAAFLERNELADCGHILSIAPTVLALLGLPRGADMADEAFVAVLDERARKSALLAPVPTHDTGFRRARATEVPAGMKTDFVKRFQQLGYIGSDGQDANLPPQPQPPQQQPPR
ncbi:MAG: hypothetical protein RL277_2146 [Planctomycetota bacterium]